MSYHLEEINRRCREDAAAYIAALKKAADVCSSTGNSDDGYAVSEINTLLEKAPAPVAPSTLTISEIKKTRRIKSVISIFFRILMYTLIIRTIVRLQIAHTSDHRGTFA